MDQKTINRYQAATIYLLGIKKFFDSTTWVTYSSCLRSVLTKPGTSDLTVVNSLEQALSSMDAAVFLHNCLYEMLDNNESIYTNGFRPLYLDNLSSEEIARAQAASQDAVRAVIQGRSEEGEIQRASRGLQQASNEKDYLYPNLSNLRWAVVLFLREDGEEADVENQLAEELRGSPTGANDGNGLANMLQGMNLGQAQATEITSNVSARLAEMLNKMVLG
jgi:hypothetical protein